MNWFFIALLGPLFWSISNHIDKFLLSKYFKGIGKEALILYSTLFGIVVLPIAYFADRKIFSVEIHEIIVLVVAGCISSIAIYFYLYALEKDEASVVVPFFQTIPIFGFILGLVLLKEILSLQQILGSLIIIIGASILSLELNKQNIVRFKSKVILLMLCSSFFFATYETLFKVVAVENGFWVSVFWEYVGLLLFGIFLFCFREKNRSDFLHLIKNRQWKLFSVNMFNEILTIIGNMFSNFALLLAPITLVMSVSGYQPIFVFIEGLILTFFFPKITKESVLTKNIIQKILSILTIFIGTIIIYK